jgi:hypothetical protein
LVLYVTVQSLEQASFTGSHELKHAGDTTAAHPKTLDFSVRSVFLVGTTEQAARSDRRILSQRHERISRFAVDSLMPAGTALVAPARDQDSGGFGVALSGRLA